jgi:hypothetical protein
MIIPLVCLFLGLLIFAYTIPIGFSLFQPIPDGFTRGDLFRYLIGYALIATALALGIVGYLVHLNSEILRPARIVIGVLGCIVLSYQFIEIHARK